MNCPKCGTENSAQARYCANCGFDLKGIIVETPGQPAQISASSGQALVTPPQSSGSIVPVQPQVITIPINPPYAGFWLRLVATLIDGVIISAVTLPLAIVVVLLNVFSLRGSDFGAGLAISPIINLVSVVGEWLYYALMESSSYQGTLGKMALSLKVTDLAGNRISFGRATGRFFGKWLSNLILGIGYLMIAFTEKKQGLHDMIAGTLVVRK